MVVFISLLIDSAVARQFRNSPLNFPDGKVAIDNDRIEEDAKWNGLRGIVAQGRGENDPRELVAQYRRLAEIESSLRTDKQDIKTRPIFHWKECRVRARIAIRCMAFCCVRHLRVRPDRAGCRVSADRIRLALNEIEIRIMRKKSGRELFAYPTAAPNDAKKLCFAAFEVERPAVHCTLSNDTYLRRVR